jgi:phosphoketolase
VKADAIVTDDTRAGFKTSLVLIDAGSEVVHPHEFAANTVVAAHPEAGVRALVVMSKRMSAPSPSPHQLLEELRERYDTVEVAEILSTRLSERT